MQILEDSSVAMRPQGRLEQARSLIDASRPGIYLLAPVVARKPGRRRKGAGREPATVLLGPFHSEVAARFMQTSAHALGLVVERTDAWPFRSDHRDLATDSHDSTRSDFFPAIDLAWN